MQRRIVADIGNVNRQFGPPKISSKQIIARSENGFPVICKSNNRKRLAVITNCTSAQGLHDGEEDDIVLYKSAIKYKFFRIR